MIEFQALFRVIGVHDVNITVSLGATSSLVEGMNEF